MLLTLLVLNVRFAVEACLYRRTSIYGGFDVDSCLKERSNNSHDPIHYPFYYVYRFTDNPYEGRSLADTFNYVFSFIDHSVEGSDEDLGIIDIFSFINNPIKYESFNKQLGNVLCFGQLLHNQLGLNYAFNNVHDLVDDLNFTQYLIDCLSDFFGLVNDLKQSLSLDYTFNDIS